MSYSTCRSKTESSSSSCGDYGDYGDTFDQPTTEPKPSRIQFHGEGAFTTLDGDLEGMRATFLRDETGQVTHIQAGRLLIKES